MLVTMSAFIRAGLENNELCIAYIKGDLKPELLKLLGRVGSTAMRSGAFYVLENAGEFYHGSRLLVEARLAKLCEKASNGSFNCARVTGQVEMVLSEASLEQLINGETVLNKLLPELPMVVLCEYPFHWAHRNWATKLFAAHQMLLNSVLTNEG